MALGVVDPPEEVQDPGLVFAVQLAGRLVAPGSGGGGWPGRGRWPRAGAARRRGGRGGSRGAARRPITSSSGAARAKRSPAGTPRRLHGQGHVLDGAQPRQEVEALEDEADRLQAQAGPGVVVQVGQVVAVQAHRPLGGPVEQPEDLQQGALAGARRGRRWPRTPRRRCRRLTSRKATTSLLARGVGAPDAIELSTGAGGRGAGTATGGALSVTSRVLSAVTLRLPQDVHRVDPIARRAGNRPETRPRKMARAKTTPYSWGSAT